MSRTAFRCAALAASLLLTGLLAACGSSHREGNGNPSNVARIADEATCRVCHAATLDPVSATPIVRDFLQSVHNPDGPNAGVNPDPDNKPTGCQGCHGGGAEHNGVGPIPFPNPLVANRCVFCHTNVPAPAVAKDFSNVCAPCHTDTTLGKQGIHAARSIDSLPNPDNCVTCHAIPAPQHGNLVGDNNGVRAVVGEFAKWSHHVTGVDLQSAHCATCHLEGEIGPDGTIIRSDTFHMVDNKVHLRNADSDADMPWDPANPDFTLMDNFCMSCHDGDGATSTQNAAIRALMIPAPGRTASATNPFGDTISNRYDKLQRPAVVNAKDQFATTNNSHHAVRGPRYSGRTRSAGPRQIASPGTFANNSSNLMKGVRSTIFDAGNFNALYVPLGTDGTDATGLGDDSTLHCGDCHTVGQWTAGSSVSANGTPTPVAIGAHGSNNEYLLRNSIGTDQRHTQNAFTLSTANVVTYTNPNGAFLVCYNCHAYSKYGSIYVGTGLDVGPVGPHAGEYDQAGRCNGIANTLPFNGYTTGKATDGTQYLPRLNGVIGVNTAPAPYAGEQSFGGANGTTGGSPIFEIQCLNCHNSGTGNAYGGIHGSNLNQNTVTQTVDPSVSGGAYIDGRGNTTKIERFLPGLGNAMHVPGTLGGVTNGVTNDTNWEQKHWQQTATTNFNFSNGTVTGGLVSAGAGCYTLGAGAGPATSALRGPSVTGPGGPNTVLLGTWGGCTDHNAAQGGADHGFVKRIVRPITY